MRYSMLIGNDFADKSEGLTARTTTYTDQIACNAWPSIHPITGNRRDIGLRYRKVCADYRASQ